MSVWYFIISVTYPYSTRFGDIPFVLWYFIVYSYISAFLLFVLFCLCLFARCGDLSIVLWYFFFSVTDSFSVRFGDIPFVFWYFIINSLSAFAFFIFIFVCLPVLVMFRLSCGISFSQLHIPFLYVWLMFPALFCGISISQCCTLQLKQNQMKGKF